MLALKKDEDDCYHCPVINCDHPGFTSKWGCRKHVNTIHPWYFYFDENPGRDISDENTSSSSTQDLEIKTCTIYMPSYPVNSGVALEFSSWLAAICGGGISRSKPQQTAYRDQDTLSYASSKVDYSVGEHLYMLPSDMTLKIRLGTVGYNNKILVSDGKFSLEKNDEVNETPKISHQSTITNHHELEKGPNITQAQKPNITHHELAKEPTHEDEKIVLALALAGGFAMLNVFR